VGFLHDYYNQYYCDDHNGYDHNEWGSGYYFVSFCTRSDRNPTVNDLSVGPDRTHVHATYLPLFEFSNVPTR
jgi:hypothetical protein